MLLAIVPILAAIFSALPIESAELAIRPHSRELVPSGTYYSYACAEAIARDLADQNETFWGVGTTNSTVLQEQFLRIVQDCLSSNPRCISSLSTNDTIVLNRTWMQYPSWYNGPALAWLQSLITDAATSATFSYIDIRSLEQLPVPAALSSASAMRDYTGTTRGQERLAVVSSDLSGFSQAWVVENTGFAGYPENSCLDMASPQGPVSPRTFLLLFYRADALTALKDAGHVASASPPDHWDALLELLRVHAAARAASAASTLPTYGLCITTDPSCGRLGDVLAAIAASVVQTTGTAQGYVYDLSAAPPAASPLVNGTAWRHAMELLQRLLQYNAPDTGDFSIAAQQCHKFSPWFASGDCLITIDWDVAFMWMYGVGKPSGLRVAPLLGSRKVLDPKSASGISSSNNNATTITATADGMLLQCSSIPELCAVSGNHDLLYLTSAGQAPAAVVAARDARAKCGVAEAVKLEAAAAAAAMAAAGGGSLNRAPYSVLMDYYVYINYTTLMASSMASEISLVQNVILSRLGDVRQTRQAAIDLMRQAAAAAATGAAGKRSWNATSFPMTPWWPGIAGDGGAIPSAAMKPYIDAGHDADAVKSYLQALWHAINSPNMATDVPSPEMINWFKWAISHAAAALQSPESTPGKVETAAALLSRFFALAIEMYTPESVRSAYMEAINASAWQVPEFAQLQDDDSSDSKSGLSSDGMVAVAVASVVMGLLLLGLLAVYLQRRLRDRHHDLLGRVLAPRAGPDTTLLISDVQNSTALWEQLPGDVMDIALKLHHTTFRRLLSRYDGYESGTEGDSFILAFADPTNALAFAAACQVELLLQEWPQQLLEQPDGHVVLIDPRDDDAAAQNAAALNGNGDFRRMAAPSSPLLSTVVARLRSAASLALRGASVSPQPENLQHPSQGPYSSSYPAVAAAAAVVAGAGSRGASMFDLASSGSMLGGNQFLGSRSRSVDLGAPRGPYGGASGAAVAMTAVAAAAGSSRTLSGDIGGVSAAADAAAATADLLPVKNVAFSGTPYDPSPMPYSNANSLNPRTVASLSPMVSGICDPGALPRSEVLSGSSGSVLSGVGCYVANSKLFPSRHHSHGFPAFTWLPTLRETPPSPWATPSSSAWITAMRTAFPMVPPHELPVTVMGGHTLRSPVVHMPSGRLALVAYRGLRVRMGLHTGLEDGQYIMFNKVASAFKYHGPFAETAKCTIDTAPGGMVVLSSQTFARLRHCFTLPGGAEGAGGPSSGAAAASGPSTAAKKRHAKSRGTGTPEALVLYAGHHVLKTAPPAPPPKPRNTGGGGGRGGLSIVRFSLKGEALRAIGEAEAEVDAEAVAAEGTALYQAVPSTLSCRLALSGSLVTKRVLQLSSLQAPIGCISVAFMYVVGASTLLAEIPGPARRALSQFQRLVFRLLGAKGGYLVEGEDGLVLAAFRSPTAAVEWALDCVAGLKKLAWEPELLSHWLCEEVLSVGVRTDPTAGRGADDDDDDDDDDDNDDDDKHDDHGNNDGEKEVKQEEKETTETKDTEPGSGEGVGGNSSSSSSGSGGGSADGGGNDKGGGGGGGGDGGCGDISPTRRRGSLRRFVSRMPSMARLGAMATTRRVLERGLRIKVGLDTGPATHTLNEASGRLAYRGRVMNRASRVAGKAATGQVVCTDACWRGCLEGAEDGGKGSGDGEPDSMKSAGEDTASLCNGGDSIGGLAGISLGKVALKGVSAPVELIQCMRS